MKKYISLVFAALAVLVSCQQHFQEHWNLALDYDSLKMGYAETNLPIMIYTDGDWTATLTEGGSWAVLDVEKGAGVTLIHLICEPNDAMARKAVLEVSTATKTRTMEIIQKAGIALPRVEFSRHDLKCPSVAVSGEISYTTNIPDRFFAGTYPDVRYVTGDQWLTGLTLVEKTITFAVAANDSGADREAFVRFVVKDDEGVEYGDSLKVVQVCDAPVITLPEKVSLTREAGSAKVDLESNFFDYTDLMTAELTSGDFVSGITLQDGSITFNVSENITGALREAVIEVSFTDAAGVKTSASTTVEQSTAYGPRVISTVEQLNEWNASYADWTSDDVVALGADFTLGADWTPHAFPGSFDGRNFQITLTGAKCIFTEVSGMVENLKIAGSLANGSVLETVQIVAPIAHVSGTLKKVRSTVAVSVAAGAVPAEVTAVYAAGIVAVAENSSTVSDCVYAAEIINRAPTAALFHIGGVVAEALENVQITGCQAEGARVINNAAVTSAEGAMLGGILGYAAGNGTVVSGCSTSRGTNGTVADISAVTAGSTTVGGIIGCAAAEITVDGCTNNTDVKKGSNICKTFSAGGIVGQNKTVAVKVIRNCTNLGDVYASKDCTSGAYLAGILGFANAVAVNIESCINKGKIYFSAKGAYSYVAGMLAYTTRGGLILDCQNDASIYENSTNATAGGIRAGGIVGAPSPTDAALVVRNCVSKGSVRNISTEATKLHCLGGISGAGNGKGVQIESCKVDAEISSVVEDATLVKAGLLIGRVNIANNSSYSNQVKGSVCGTVVTSENYASMLWGAPEGTNAVKTDSARPNIFWE